MKIKYIAVPISTDNIILPQKLEGLMEQITQNVHEGWSIRRFAEGWKSGKERNNARKPHPCLVPYNDLLESEKEFDRNTVRETLKLIQKLRFSIIENKTE